MLVGMQVSSIFPIMLGLENEPAPTAYNYGVCKDRTMSKSSSYTIPQGRRRGTVLWSKRGIYNSYWSLN